MHRARHRWGFALVFVIGTSSRLEAADRVRESRSERPDPASVERFGPAYRYPQAGWIVLHIEGKPYERGYQHGRLLAPEIGDYLKALANKRSPKAPTDAWRQMRTLVNSLFLRRYDKEYLEEMKGIADGAAAAGARFDGRPLDLIDVVAINADVEVEFLDEALRATPNGLEGERFPEPADTAPRHAPPEHCSAFAATGPATADGKIVFGHITMFNIYMVRHYNVWLDVKPARGHRVLMQSYPGGIQSGMDYYYNDAGLLIAETTIEQTRFNADGQALASRIRKTLQYADSIDTAVAILKESNNGMYTNEWLLADTKTNEIAMFELGTHKTRLWRSSNDEWIGGTKGFYWGCNNTKDLEVRLETVASLDDKPANAVFRPSDRDMTWIRLYEKHRGKIGVEFGFESFTTPPLAAFPSCDAKFTTTAMAKELKTWAVFGPPLGKTWEPSPHDRARYDDVLPLVGNDWTVLSADSPTLAPEKSARAVDLASTKRDAKPADKEPEVFEPLPPAWRGTILPENDGDIWLATAFADYEKIIALEKALRHSAKDRPLNALEKDRIALAHFAPRSRYLTAVERGREDIPLAKIHADFTHNTWYDIAAGKGVLLLASLHHALGDAEFMKFMDDFGRSHAGKAVSTDQFREALSALKLKPSVLETFDAWLTKKGLPDDAGGGLWAIDSFEEDLEHTLIVYGTLKESDAQHEAAEHLQREIARRWSNATVPIRSDQDLKQDFAGSHLLLVGRPDSNALVARVAGALPLTFGPHSFVLRRKTYAHPSTSVIAAGKSPLHPHREIVVYAGLSAEATWRCTQRIGHRDSPPAEVLLFEAGEQPRRLALPAEHSTQSVAERTPDRERGARPRE